MQGQNMESIGSLLRSQHALMVPKDGRQAEAFRDTLNSPVRIAVGWSPIFCNAPTSAVIDYLHCVCQLGEDDIVRERRQVGMSVSMHRNVVLECVERNQKQIWIRLNMRADEEVRCCHIFFSKEII